MDQDTLYKAYSAEEFRKLGHQMVDRLADHLHTSIEGRTKQVLDWKIPEEEHMFWRNFMENGNPEEIAEHLIQRCIHIHHPRYMGHQISPVVPITGLTNLLSAVLNNGMGIYEMGSAPTAMERVVTDMLCQSIGFDVSAGGFITSGGTLANLTALLSARQNYIRVNNLDEDAPGKLGVLVSDEAHYCADRAVKIMGLGSQGIIKVPVDEQFRLRTDLLDSYLEECKNNGIKVFALIGCAPSTAAGMYDNLAFMARFADKHRIWFHVDGAHGGAAIFSSKYKSLLNGIEKADSVVIDGHKMMMMPAITTALLFKDRKNSHLTFKQKADYLLEESAEEDWYNLAKRTFECTKHMMSLHWYTLLKIHGNKLFDEFVTKLYDLAREFAEVLKSDPNFELVVEPMSNILCFRYVGSAAESTNVNEINKKLRQKILEDGTYYIVQTKLRGTQYFRATIMNPFTTTEDFYGLLAKIKDFSKP